MFARLSLLAAAVLVIAGCASTPGGSKPTSQSTASPSSKASEAPSSPPIASPSPLLLSCQGQDVSAELGAADSSAGHLVYVVILNNTGVTACTLDGYPTVTLLSSSSAPLPTNQTDGNDGISSISNTPTVVTVPTGGTASFVLQWSDVPTDGDTCPTSTWLEVQLPTQSVGALSDTTLQACGGDIFASPFRSGTAAP